MAEGERAAAAGRAVTGARQRPVRPLTYGVAVVLAVTLLLLFVPKIGKTGVAQVDVTPANAPGSPGLTVAKVRCAQGVRQIPWSHYAPVCEPKWSGDNGGATAPGVTGTTITLTYREASTTELNELYALLPASVVGTNPEAVHTLQAYINTFNKYFELYGRHVVLQTYTGKSNFISEDTGTDVNLAVEDALTAASTYHAFADMSLVDSSDIYEQDLSQQQVSAFGLYLEDANFYAQHSPYLYTPGPDCSKTADAIGAVLGRGLGGLDAIYAGDASLRHSKRVYGIVYADNPEAAACAQLIEQALANAGHPVAAHVAVEFDPSKLVTQAQLAMSLMKSSGVTTVICSSCDPVTPIFYLEQAQSAGYHPEWLFQSVFAGSATSLDGFVRNDLKGAPSEGSGIMSFGSTPVYSMDQEAIEAYKLGNHGSLSGILPSYPIAYESILYFFDLLQAAGPDLNPQTLRAAMGNTAELVPSSPGAEFGGWQFGVHQADPASDFELLRWSSTQVSSQDGQAGSYLECYGGRTFRYADADSQVPAHTQPSCQ